MNYDTVDNILWPYDKEDEPRQVCDCGCGREVSSYPIIIDGWMLSDHCASDLTHLRMQAGFHRVSDKTKKL
jgi:hypothetical protein